MRFAIGGKLSVGTGTSGWLLTILNDGIMTQDENGWLGIRKLLAL